MDDARIRTQVMLMMTSLSAHAEVLEVPRYCGPAESADVFEAIYRRRAVRSYSNEPVTRAEIEGLLEAAIMAPSAINAQPWAFVVLQGREELARYAQEGRDVLASVSGQGNSQSASNGLLEMVSAPDFQLFHGAPAVIVIYATNANAVAECFLAAQNLMLSAWAMRLGTCPIGLARPLFDQERVKVELKIPPSWPHALAIAVGHPSGETAPTPRRAALVVTWR
jgi:nitroreductase